MVEPLLSGIILGLMAVTLLGLFVAAYLQFKRGNELAIWSIFHCKIIKKVGNILNYQLALVTPGRRQSWANSRTTFRHNPKYL